MSLLGRGPGAEVTGDIEGRGTGHVIKQLANSFLTEKHHEYLHQR